ncbi:HesA/MoeB/ThiF family protein [Haloflavibacter putidus]|uniref:HesA/MoeB/ThiF family protein n=1 Tax=Haloflavibacter putidus TaxID=2576776 RepID=UPI001F348AB5|nr:HesA/MoeB/ThiF family protein [Haloflavibacter putidus]
MERYKRHVLFKEIGEAGQAKISAAKVLVIGAGGLGCPVLQYLAAAGIGKLGIVDFDLVEESNLQRQVLFDTASIGKNKAETAREILLALNPNIDIQAYPEKLTPKNVERIFQDYEIVVDATDNFPVRYLINDACVVFNKPLVYGAIYKFEGQVTVFNFQNGPTYRCLFSEPPKKDAVPNCAEIGVLGVLPGIIGTMQATEVLKIILGIGKPLSGKLFCFNTLTNQSASIGIKKNASVVAEIKARGLNFESYEEASFCGQPISEIDLQQLSSKENLQFIDVRELTEMPRIENENLLEIPLSGLTENLWLISKEKKKVIFCQTGIRSKTAVSLLQAQQFTDCHSLKNGVAAFQQKQKENTTENQIEKTN